jgi:hypothetical protein
MQQDSSKHESLNSTRLFTPPNTAQFFLIHWQASLVNCFLVNYTLQQGLQYVASSCWGENSQPRNRRKRKGKLWQVEFWRARTTRFRTKARINLDSEWTAWVLSARIWFHVYSSWRETIYKYIYLKRGEEKIWHKSPGCAQVKFHLTFVFPMRGLFNAIIPRQQAVSGPSLTGLIPS